MFFTLDSWVNIKILHKLRIITKLKAPTYVKLV